MSADYGRPQQQWNRPPCPRQRVVRTSFGATKEQALREALAAGAADPKAFKAALPSGRGVEQKASGLKLENRRPGVRQWHPI